MHRTVPRMHPRSATSSFVSTIAEQAAIRSPEDHSCGLLFLQLQALTRMSRSFLEEVCRRSLNIGLRLLYDALVSRELAVCR